MLRILKDLMPFWWKWPFWPQWPHSDPWPHHLLCVSSGQGTGYFDQVWSKWDVGKYVKKTCYHKKKQKLKQKRVRYKTQTTFKTKNQVPYNTECSLGVCMGRGRGREGTFVLLIWSHAHSQTYKESKACGWVQERTKQSSPFLKRTNENYMNDVSYFCLEPGDV